MIRKTIQLITLGVLLNAGVNAQSVEDAKKAYFDGKLFEAVEILKSQAGSNPEAAYWLTKAYIAHDDIDLAKSTLSSAIGANANNALLLAAKGQLALIDKKPAEAKKDFEAAIAAAGKGDKNVILNAVGGAIAKEFNNVEKIGDINYAVTILKEAFNAESGLKEKKQDKRLLAAIAVNLGDALRKQNPGEGSEAYKYYQDALMFDPTFVQAEFRKALIFKSQRNYQMMMERLEKAIAANSAFVPALYEMYYYWLGIKDLNSAQLIADKIKQATPQNPNNEYFTASTYYIDGKYDQAISSAKSVIASAGSMVNPAAFKVIAYSLIEGKKDTAAAIPYVDDYFKRQNKEQVVPKDYILKAIAYSTTPGKEQEVYQTLMTAVDADTSVANKIEILEEAAKLYATKGNYAMQADLNAKLLDVKPADKVTINDYFNAGYYGYYRSGQYEKSWKIFDKVRTKYSNVNYGYLWTFQNSKIFDSVNAKNVLVPDAEKLIAFSQTDSAKDAKSNIFNAAFTLATYYNNVKSDKENGLKYLLIAYDAQENPAVKEQLAPFIEQLGGSVTKTQ
ncbi:MAG: hypothetical protein ACK5NK_08365 [Niabella sp.]